MHGPLAKYCPPQDRRPWFCHSGSDCGGYLDRMSFCFNTLKTIFRKTKRIIIIFQKSINILLMVFVVGTTGDGLALGNP